MAQLVDEVDRQLFNLKFIRQGRVSKNPTTTPVVAQAATEVSYLGLLCNGFKWNDLSDKAAPESFANGRRFKYKRECLIDDTVKAVNRAFILVKHLKIVDLQIQGTQRPLLIR